MAIQNFIGAIATSAAFFAASMSGVELATELLSEPLIEGYGIYEKPVRAGETIEIEWIITKRTDCNGVSGRVWKGQLGFYMSEAMRPTGLPSGEAMRITIPTTVPEQAPIGELQLQVKGFYNCARDRHDWFLLSPVLLVVG